MLTISDPLRCPRCGGGFRLHEATDLPEALRLAATANRFGRLWPSVCAYVESFQAAGGRGLTLARFLALVAEVENMFTDQGFTYGRRRHRIDRDVLVAALRETAQAGKSGFKNHNYLKKVAIEMQSAADRIRVAEKEQRLREKEARLRTGVAGPDLVADATRRTRNIEGVASILQRLEGGVNDG